MPRYNNKFDTPKYIEEKILDNSGGVVGTIRIKPSTVLWKPKGKQKFLSVTLESFHKWITTTKAAVEVSS